MFFSEILTQYPAYRGSKFSRSQAYRKNDQAWFKLKIGVCPGDFWATGGSRAGGGTNHSPPIRDHAVVRELFPALGLDDGKVPQRSSGDQTLQLTGHPLRASHAT